MKKKCQVFTPFNYVEKLLDSVDYKSDLYGKKILENSCGAGNILLAIVQRYINDCKKQKMGNEKIRKGLEKDICGIEIDEKQHKICIENLNRVLAYNRIKKIKWSIFNVDYLRTDDASKYQFVVGNPPYITYKEMKAQDRMFLKANFESCAKGKFDYCYAFIEKSINALAKDGKMAYLIPSSIFKSVFGEKLRSYIVPYITEIQDFTQVKMFDNALVKSAIMVLEKNEKKTTIYYIDTVADIEINVNKNELEKKWFFSNDKIVGTRRFGDYFQVSHVVATLLNEAYVIKKDNYIETDKYYQVDGVNIEKEIVRDTATPRSKRYRKIEKIIFPYNYVAGKLVRFTDMDFYQNFPGAFQYLSRFREKLNKRDSDRNAKWFEFGRSQALMGLNHKKLLISTVVTDELPVYILTKKCIPYSGMYIVAKRRNQIYKLEDAKVILESDKFMKYVKTVGIHISGSSIRLTSRDIEEYKF